MAEQVKGFTHSVASMQAGVATPAEGHKILWRVVLRVFPFHDVMCNEVHARPALLTFVSVALKNLVTHCPPCEAIEASTVSQPFGWHPRSASTELAAVLALTLHTSPRPKWLAARRAEKRDPLGFVEAAARTKEATIIPFIPSRNVKPKWLRAILARSLVEAWSAFRVAVVKARMRSGVRCAALRSAAATLITTAVAHLRTWLEVVNRLRFSAFSATLNHGLNNAFYQERAVMS